MLNLFQHLLVIHTDPDPEYSGQGDNIRIEIIQPLIRINNLYYAGNAILKLFNSFVYI